MISRRYWSIVGCLLALWFAGSTAELARAQTDTFNQPDTSFSTVEKAKRKAAGFFHKASRETPEAQLAYAQQLLDKGHERRARKAFNALVYSWHDSPQAVTAQREYARLLLKAGKYEKAFDEYQYLIDYFAGYFPYTEVLEVQLTIANAVRTDRHADILGLPGYQDPARALPLYEKILENGPNWDRAPEVAYTIGIIHEDAHDYDLSVVAFESLLLRYPSSGYAVYAAYHRAYGLYELADHSPRDEDRCREGLTACLAFTRNYPNDEHAKDMSVKAEELKQRLADMYFDKATYYDKIAQRPESAIIAYSDFVQKFPTSKRRAVADARIAALQLELERNHEN